MASYTDQSFNLGEKLDYQGIELTASKRRQGSDESVLQIDLGACWPGTKMSQTLLTTPIDTPYAMCDASCGLERQATFGHHDHLSLAIDLGRLGGKMTEVSQGFGSRQASDRKWYAPDRHIDYVPPSPAQPPNDVTLTSYGSD